jgi:hypothetical protein
MINKYRHPILSWILDSWPAMIWLPSVLLLIAVLVLITRWWDERDRHSRRYVGMPRPKPQRPPTA